jgi:hypothetical protein
MKLRLFSVLSYFKYTIMLTVICTQFTAKYIIPSYKFLKILVFESSHLYHDIISIYSAIFHSNFSIKFDLSEFEF